MTKIAAQTFNFEMAHAILRGRVKHARDFRKVAKELKQAIEPNYGPITAEEIARFDIKNPAFWKRTDGGEVLAREVSIAELLDGTEVLGLHDPQELAQRLQDGLRAGLYEAVSLPTGKMIRLLDVNDDVQTTNYSCGPTAARSVFRFYGIECTEEELMAEMGTTPEQGTHPESIARSARARGLAAEVKEHMTIDDLIAAVYPRSREDRPIPVIIDIQAWRDGEDLTRPWTTQWENGHYVVVIGVDDDHVYFEDPSIEGTQGQIARNELLDRWHDYEGPSPERGKKYIRSGILISGREPKAPAIIAIE